MNTRKAKIIFLRIIRNKYVITFLIFYLWLFFFDQHSIWERKSNESTIEALEKEKVYYLEKIENDKKRIHELKTNRKPGEIRSRTIPDEEGKRRYFYCN